MFMKGGRFFVFRNRFFTCCISLLLCFYVFLGFCVPAVSSWSCSGFGVVPAYASGVVVSGSFQPSDGEWQPIRRSLWTRVLDWVTGVFTDEPEDEIPTQVIPSKLGTTEIFQLTPDTVLTQASTAFIRSDSFLWLRDNDIYPTGLSSSNELFDWLPYEGTSQSTGVNLIAGYSGFANRTFELEKLFGASGIGATVYSYYSFTTSSPVEDFRVYLRTVWENEQPNTTTAAKVYPDDVTLYIQRNPDWSYQLDDVRQEFYYNETKDAGLSTSDYKGEVTFSTSLTQPGQYGILVVYTFDNATAEEIAGKTATMSLSSYLIAANASPVSSGGTSVVPGPIASDVSAVSGVSYANASGDVFTGSLYDVTNGSVYNPVTNTNVVVDTWNYDSASQKYTFSTESGDIVYTFAPNYVTYTAADGFGISTSGRLTYVADDTTIEEFEKEEAANKTEQEEEQTGIIGSIGKALGDLFGGVLGAIASIFQSILSGLTGLVENIVGLLDTFTALPASVFSFLGDILGVFPPEVVGLFSGAFALFVFVALIKFFRG